MDRIKASKMWLKYPTTLEVNYYREFAPLIKRVKELTNEIVSPKLGELLSESVLSSTSESFDSSPSKKILEIFNSFKERLFGSRNKFQHFLELVVERSGRVIAKKHQIRFGQNAKQITGIDLDETEPWLKGYLEDWTVQNVELISDVPRDAVKNLQKQMMESVLRGDSKDYLEEKIQDILKTTEKRAKGIARDQTNKLYGALSEIRSKVNGWYFYEWDTAGDEKVRKDHRKLDGKIYKFTEPPIVNSYTGAKGNPGFDFNCRCIPRVIHNPEIYNNLKKNTDGSYSLGEAL